MSSAGQIVGGIAGGVIGFFATLGNPYGAIQGAAIGASIGGYIDPPPGPNLRGPTLGDKSFQSAAYGVSIPNLYGTIATMGNVIWLENNEYKAVEKKQSQGGKGGGGGTYTTTTYFATFAVALAEASAGSKPRRIWAGGKLIYSSVVSDSSDVESIAASTGSADGWRYYDGTQTEPDSRMEAQFGVGNCPSYEGTQYIVFYDFELTDYGNGLAGCPIKVEITTSNDQDWHWLRTEILSGKNGFSENNHYSLLALDESGRSVRASLSEDGLRVATEIIDVRGYSAFVVGGDISQDPIPMPRTIPGYSETARYAFSVAKYNFDEDYYDYSVLTSNGGFASPFQNGAYEVAEFNHIYDIKNQGSYFLIRASFYQPPVGGSLTPEQWYFWGSSLPGSGLLAATLGTGQETDACAVGPDYVVFIQRGVTEAYVKLYNLEDLTLRETFTLTLEDAVTNQTACLIKNEKLYYLSDINVLKFGIIDLVEKTVEYKTVDAESLPSATIFKAINIVGNLLCASYESGAKEQYFYYIAMSGSDAAGAVLSDVVAKEMNKCDLAPNDYDVSELTDIVDGYRVTGPGSARGSIGALQAAYLFDLVEVGYKLVARRRGGAVSGTIPASTLMQVSEGVVVKSNYENVNQLPATYTVQYFDVNREYDVNTQTAPYPTLLTNARTVDFPIVMSAQNAAVLADVLVNLAHVESKVYSFVLPQTYLAAKPGDIWNIETQSGRTEVVRFDSVNYGAGQVIEISARRHEYSSYQSSAIGVDVDPPVVVIPFIADTATFLLDIPMMLPAMDAPGYVGVAIGGPNWPGSVLFRSDDGGQAFAPLQVFEGQGVVGTGLNALAADEGFVIDYVSVLSVSVLYGEFESITEEQMLTGRHYLAYGRDGRWEIMQYATAVVTVDGVDLSCLVRGCRGTEWATGLHEAGDLIVLLDDPDNIFISSDIAEIANQKQYKSVTVRQNVTEVDPFTFTYQAINLKPLSPAYATGRIVAGNWEITCFLRTRYSSSFFYTGVNAVNESVISIDYDIYKDGAVVRRINSASEQVIYTDAMQLIDFGSLQSTLTLKIYQVSQRVGRGFPLEVTL